MRRIGVLGASFNPPTKGHADVVSQALDYFDEILLVPSLSHAFEKALIPLSYRLEMLKLFLEQWPDVHSIKIVNIEPLLQHLQHQHRSIYTYDVLHVLNAIYETEQQAFEMQFIIGPDNAQKAVWQKFYRYQDIEKRWSLFIARENKPIHSTQVRQLCSQKKNAVALAQALEGKVDNKIIDFIIKNKLYTDPAILHQEDLKTITMQITTCVFRIQNEKIQILLENTPFQNQMHYGLPSITFSHVLQNLQNMVENQLQSVLNTTPFIEQVLTEGYPEAQQGSFLKIVYYGLCNTVATLPPLYEWVDYDHISNCVFLPHQAYLISKSLERLQSKSLYTSLPVYLLKKEFTLTELQKAFEIILGFKLEKKSFRRRFLDAQLLLETGKHTKAKHRPAQIYRLKNQEPYVFPRIIEGARKV